MYLPLLSRVDLQTSSSNAAVCLERWNRLVVLLMKWFQLDFGLYMYMMKNDLEIHFIQYSAALTLLKLLMLISGLSVKIVQM